MLPKGGGGKWFGLVYPYSEGSYNLQHSNDPAIALCVLGTLRFSKLLPCNPSCSSPIDRATARSEISPWRSHQEHLICSGVPPDVAFVMAHAASFLVRNSAFCKISISTGKMFASMTAWGERGVRRIGIGNTVSKMLLSTGKKPPPPFSNGKGLSKL